ncbi:rho guanine nucleotide exchange factor 19 [Thalassophryne amazonica]|uniref:rho guanine nucleotide exchange factor 19 n=1 Tax=Thalassophryne amazonica TaxID=390379 RepID=UPI001471B7B6|nr:rho guanine nucleotide exchange factor 19 [Thalassophryne amazonica]
MWDSGKMYSPVPKLSVPPLEGGMNFPLLSDCCESTEGAADPGEEAVQSVPFQSKYIHIFPLYQDYCLQAVKDDLHRLNKDFLSELLRPQCLSGLHCRLISPSQSEAASPPLQPAEVTLSPRQTPPHPKVTCAMWRDLEEVKASDLLSSLSTREIRLQESMFELIGSEASYLKSLGVVVNHFYASEVLKKTVSQLEHHILFSNIGRVMAASENFLMDLEIRLGESVLISQVGDIVLQHCPAFWSLYVPYVTNMMYQETLISQLQQQNKEFLFAVKKLESDAVCQRQSLKSFLVLPFQRITRLKLLLETIIKLTDQDSEPASNLRRATEAINEILTHCDKRIQKMKQIEELVCLELLLDYENIKSVPLVVGGRFLMHQGPVRQLIVEGTNDFRTSFINIYLHLFNDLLIISSKKEQRFRVLDHAEFPTHVQVQDLKTEVLALPPESFLLHLSRSQTRQPTAMILAPHTKSDQEVWMKVLSSKRGGDQDC